MPLREIPGDTYGSKMKNKILDTATKLFALKGVGSVSMRDIGEAVGIKMSSIYYYYKGKDALLDDILSRFENGYRNYFDWLTDLNREVDSLETLMDNMFSKEFTEVLDPLGRFGISLVNKEQHNNESARKHYFELILKHSIMRLKADFDRLIDKGVIPPSDTKTTATIFMFSVIALNEIRIHEYAGAELPIDCTEIYAGLKKMITLALTASSGETIPPNEACPQS